MNIVIVGDGKVGYTLAEYLSQENHDVTMIDKNINALNKAGDTLDVLCIQGNGANAKTLIDAGVDRADIIIAATTNDETNMVCCLVSKQLGAQYSIARIRNPEYTESLALLQKGMGIDMVINPERAAALEISRLLRYPFAGNAEVFAHGRVEMVEFKAGENDSIVGGRIKDLHQKAQKIIYCAIERDDEAIIPDGEFIIRAGDRVYVAGDIQSITQYFKQLGKNTRRVRNAMLIGGGHISFYLAKIVAGMGISLKIIELNKEKCEWLSANLEDAIVILGDGTEQELLDSEGVADTDALVCLTDRDEENLMAGLYGMHAGADKVIVKINRLNYMDLIAGMGVDSVISPKHITATGILRTVRALSRSQDSVVEKIYRVVGGRVEALEFTAAEDARYLKKPLRELNIRPGVLVAVLVRNRKVIIPFGSDHIEAGDTVILIAKTSQISALDEALDAR